MLIGIFTKLCADAEVVDTALVVFVFHSVKQPHHTSMERTYNLVNILLLRGIVKKE